MKGDGKPYWLERGPLTSVNLRTEVGDKRVPTTIATFWWLGLAEEICDELSPALDERDFRYEVVRARVRAQQILKRNPGTSANPREFAAHLLAQVTNARSN